MNNEENECKGCLLEPMRKPSGIDYEGWFHLNDGGNLDVLFVSDFPHVLVRKPFIDEKHLRECIKTYGIVHYGITCVYKCRVNSQVNSNCLVKYTFCLCL